MPTPLLTTKLHVPPLRPELVLRPRLVEQLQAALCRKLTLVSAPAGFGKTTLLCEWVHGRCGRVPPGVVAWLSLDEGDGEAARFWTYLIAALQTVQAGLGQDALQILQAFPPVPTGQTGQSGAGRMQAILTPLLNEIEAIGQGPAAEGILLILDDYHHISDPAIHAGIAFLVEHLPPKMHVVIATRADPPLPIFRLRARGHLAELRSDDLRFGPGEATAFLNDEMGLELTVEDIEALEARTEGWIVGLQLAALSLQGRSDASQFISAFSGSHHYVLEYLTEEVVRRQPEPVQRFLMETSILDRLSGPLCDAVCAGGQPSPCRDGEAMLAYLYDQNLFVVGLDDERRWFRYHNLFADLLGNLLRKTFPPARLDEFHRRASMWYELNSYPDDAIRHALQAHDYERSASLIEGAAGRMLSHGQLRPLLRWIETLPETWLRARPRLCLYQGWAMHLTGQSAASQEMLDEAKKELQSQPPSPEGESLRGELAALLTGIAMVRAEPDQIISQGQEALAYLPEEAQVSRARVYVALGTARAYSDDSEQAVLSWQQARDLAFQAGNLFLGTSAIELLAGLQIFHQGRLHEAAQTLQEVLELGTTPQGQPLPFTATAHVLLAEIHREWNELETAERYLETGIELMQRGGIGYSQTHTFCAQACLRQARQDEEGALKAMRMATKAAEGCPMWHIAVHHASCQVRLWLWLGNMETAQQWAQDDPATIKCEKPDTLPLYLREVQRISQARVHLARGEAAQTLTILDTVVEQARAAGRMAHVVQAHLLQALARQSQWRTAPALAFFRQALALAEPEGYVRLFLDSGEPAVALLRQAAARGPSSGYARRLLEAVAVTPAGDGPGTGEQSLPSTPDPSSGLVEPLTRREHQVLRLICEGCSNRQISERLVVTLNTVKKHSSNIYGKLGVTSRAQAIVRAHELGLC